MNRIIAAVNLMLLACLEVNEDKMAVRERKFFVGGNWKMNGSYESIKVIIDNLTQGNLSSATG